VVTLINEDRDHRVVPPNTAMHRLYRRGTVTRTRCGNENPAIYVKTFPPWREDHGPCMLILLSVRIPSDAMRSSSSL